MQFRKISEYTMYEAEAQILELWLVYSDCLNNLGIRFEGKSRLDGQFSHF
jgi:hypothetical protein